MYVFILLLYNLSTYELTKPLTLLALDLALGLHIHVFRTHASAGWRRVENQRGSVQWLDAHCCRKPSMLVECLVPDFRGDTTAVRTIVQSGLDVFAHNIETVEFLTPHVRDPRARYRSVLAACPHRPSG
ncbi:hypothetical protein PR048_024345 [Dryococelus australis]|uniref:Uncharacterized protein n=1 Tax=Dryococelus australis TaxID=614101 RepID=A0ABQ9GNB5_9NEOP|nr:hypothetical protein PR048_024345 [Dryococelus australis]